MFRKKKIGVLGAANSGKTVLLTSLLWHLEAFSPEKFHVGSGQVGINDQEKLDSFAKERIKHYSIRGAVGATISRIPTMDRFIVLYSMFALVIDLLKIYNIRPSKLNATILLSKVVINTFLAGYSQAGAEALAEGACWIGASLTSIDPIVGKILGLGIKFSAEATVHGILIYRVGITAQKMLSPIAKK